ncbi:MAG TPA: hypothetical protein VM118_11205, partial [Acidobacteriota bacterium]|nr:hypothetical protein [Acidobacteriota bacterium]
MRRGNADPGRVGYGNNRTSGVLFFAESVTEGGKSGAELNDEGGDPSDADFLHFGIAISYGPVEWMGNIILNDTPMSDSVFKSLGTFVAMLGEDDQQQIRGPLTMEKAEQSETGAVEQFDIEMPNRWKNKNRAVSGIAYVWVVLRHNPEIFASGAPTVLVEWKGRRVYDPRLDVAESGGFMDYDDSRTWTYSNNWALVIRDFMTSRVYGMKIPNELICDTCMKVAADASDQLVDAPVATAALDDGDEATVEETVQEKRYTINGIFETDEQPIDILSRMLGAGAGAMRFYTSGVGSEQYHIKAGVAEPVSTWPDDPAIPAESKHTKDLIVGNVAAPFISGDGVGDVVVVGQQVQLSNMTTPANDGWYTVNEIVSSNGVLVDETFDTAETVPGARYDPSLRGMPVELTPDDLRSDSPLQIAPQLNRKDRVNKVGGKFVNPLKNY